MITLAAFKEISNHVCRFWAEHHCALSEKALQKALAVQLCETGTVVVSSEEETPVIFRTQGGASVTVASLRPDLIVRSTVSKISFAVEIKAGPSLRGVGIQRAEGQARVYADLLGIPVRLVSFEGTSSLYDEAVVEVREFLPGPSCVKNI